MLALDGALSVDKVLRSSGEGDTEVKEEILKGEELLAQMPVSVLSVNFPC